MRWVTLLIFVAVISSFAAPAAAQQAETESARVLAPGVVKGGAGFELQTSSEGTESAVPLIVEGGIVSRLELVVEQVAFVGLRPKVGSNESGPGDLEVTLVGLAFAERSNIPAVAFAAEVKAPVAQNTAIGTGKTDVAGYLILSKRFGALDVSLNGSYTYVGKPANVAVNNVWGFAVSGRYTIGRLDLFGEVLGNTAASPESEGMGGAAELTGSELVGTLGSGIRPAPWLHVFFNVSLDNNQAVLLHPGFMLAHAFQ